MSIALVPAGGKSRRMGRSKLSLPLFGRTVIECVIAALKEGGVEHVLVVLGPHVAELQSLVEKAGAEGRVLPKDTPDMRATVEEGLRWIEQLWQPANDDLWLLVPADHPTLDPNLVRLLQRTYHLESNASILVPVHNGQRGHPVALSWRHVDGIRHHPPNEGLNTYLRQQSATTREIVVSSGEILRDLDTPEDYKRLLQNE